MAGCDSQALLSPPDTPSYASKVVFEALAMPSELAFPAAPSQGRLEIATNAPKVFASTTNPAVCSVSPSSVNTQMVARRWGDRKRIGTFTVSALRAPGRCYVLLSDGRNLIQQVPVEIWGRLSLRSFTISGAYPVPGLSMVQLTAGISSQSTCLSESCGWILFDETLTAASTGAVFDMRPPLRVMEALTNGTPDYLYASIPPGNFGISDVSLAAGSGCGATDLAGCSVRGVRLYIRQMTSTLTTYSVRGELEVLGMRPGD